VCSKFFHDRLAAQLLVLAPPALQPRLAGAALGSHQLYLGTAAVVPPCFCSGDALARPKRPQPFSALSARLPEPVYCELRLL
jgi:hypothetical protein